FIETLIDDYIKPLLKMENPVFSGLIKAIVIMGCIYALGIVASYLQARLMVSVSQGVLKQVRDEMFGKMQTLPIKYFDTHTYGDIMSRYTNDTGALRQMITQSLPNVVSSIISVVAVFVAMIVKSRWLTLIVIVTIFFMMMISAKVGGRSGKYFAAQQKSIGEVNGYIEELINGQKVVKVFCREDMVQAEMDERNDRLCKNATEANRFANILMPMMNNLGHLQYVLLACAGAVLAVNGIEGLTLGAIAAFLQLSRGFTRPVTQISQQINSVVMALAGAERIFDLMDVLPEEDNGTVTLEKKGNGWVWNTPDGEVPLRGDVRMNNVDFGYTEEKTVLHDITLYAEPGQKVAFVGATGAGKTTITNLINRFYDISEGEILYDGINVKDIKKADLRRSLGTVLQDVNLFTGTVMENIRYGKLDATDEEVYAAAKLVGADDFIEHLPNGYDTVLEGDGSGLSQGQRQLISIARAAVADPPVMVLDEATSSIDTRTEALVQRGMDMLMHGRTVFVIAHRLSTVRNSDVIMVLENGRIIERGDHNKLIEEKGKYYELYTGAYELE
ncbi:MAG: ABC transporter ATP-binding protein, partial [Clostridia bacterium]|nr:ABC transporter ATP-binding protein [Clostridia bacterium]